jgi:hypothetical protein
MTKLRFHELNIRCGNKCKPISVVPDATDVILGRVIFFYKDGIGVASDETMIEFRGFFRLLIMGWPLYANLAQFPKLR